MARINLRPWREERDAENQKRFYVNVAVAALCGAVVVLLIYTFYGTQISRQQARNTYLKDQIALLDKKLVEIKKLNDEKARLLARLNAIHQLQGDRPLIVRNFDELVRVLPDGIYYNSVTRKGSVISIKGTAEEANDVPDLMRNLNASRWFGEPNLTRITATKDNMRSFDLAVPLAKPNEEGKGGGR